MTERELAELLRSNPDIAVDGADPYGKVVDAVMTAAHRELTVEDGMVNYSKNSSSSPRPKVSLPKLSEHEMQAAVIAECDKRSVLDSRYARIFHPASGEYRTKATAAKLKRMGVRRGLLDLYLICPNRQGKAGWACELKVGGNGPTPEQTAEINYLLSANWCASVIWDDVERVMSSLESYLG